MEDYFLDPANFTTEEILREDREYVLDPGAAHMAGSAKGNLVLVSGKGCRVKDLDGNEYLDFMGAIANAISGYGNETIINTMIKQVRSLHHSHWSTCNIPRVKLAKLVIELLPKKARMKKFFILGSGSEANEAMIKLARKYTAKKNASKFISWWECYHGVTVGALSATGQNMAKAPYWEPLAPEFIHVPMPSCYNCAFDKTYPKCNIQCAKFVKDLIKVEGADNFAGMLFEPVVSAAGGLVPPKEYFEIMYEICEKENIVLMFDEVVTGFGRTGKMFACEHFDIYPKMMSFGKGFTSGYVMASGVAVNEEIVGMGGFGGIFHGHTITGGVLPNAVAYANVSYIIDHNLVDNSKKMGDYLFDKLLPLVKKYPDVIGELRHKGLCGSIVFRKGEVMESITNEALKMGLILMGNNRVRDNLIWIDPPLVINKDDIDFAVDVIFKAFKNVLN